jgi:hypothetical protein
MWKEESFWEPLWKGFWGGLWVVAEALFCNVSTYTNPTTEESVNVPFVPCGQAYTNGDQITVNGLPMVIGSGE